jgi:hypothetical protein
MESDYRSDVVRSRRTKEAVWEGPEVLKKMYGKWIQKQCGKVKKNYRSCIKKTRRTTEVVWK